MWSHGEAFPLSSIQPASVSRSTEDAGQWADSAGSEPYCPLEAGEHEVPAAGVGVKTADDRERGIPQVCEA